MRSRLTIIVGGYIVGFPLGGMTWHHLNYLLGLTSLGHEVWFYEDSADWAWPYDPVNRISSADSTYGRAYLERTFAHYGLPLRYCYYNQFEDRYYGLSRDELHDLMRRADLLLCVSGVTPLRDDWPRIRRTAVIDTDPVYTQLRMQQDAHLRDYYRRFDAAATFGRLIGRSACPLPTHAIDWIPTNQPIALEHWPVVPTTSRAFTTLGRWEHSDDRHVEFNGRLFRSSKSTQWETMIDLPSRVPWEMTLGMQQMPADAVARFERHGWRIVDPEQATLGCDGYQQFIQQSAGEFTVAKEIYTAIPSGWFSDRSAAYLASGRPVVTQATGFDHWLPTGEGLFAVNSADQAADALDAIHSDYARHAQAARHLAETYFDAKTVLTDLLTAVL